MAEPLVYVKGMGEDGLSSGAGLSYGGYIPLEKFVAQIGLEDEIALLEERARHTSVREAYKAINDPTTRDMIHALVAKLVGPLVSQKFYTLMNGQGQVPDVGSEEVQHLKSDNDQLRKTLNSWMDSYGKLAQENYDSERNAEDSQKATTFWKRLTAATALAGVTYPALHLLGFM